MQPDWDMLTLSIVPMAVALLCEVSCFVDSIYAYLMDNPRFALVPPSQNIPKKYHTMSLMTPSRHRTRAETLLRHAHERTLLYPR